MDVPVQLGDVAQLGERRVRNAKVEGSNPFVSTVEECRMLALAGSHTQPANSREYG